MRLKKYLIITIALTWILLKYLFLISISVFIILLLLLSSTYKDLKITINSGLAGQKALTTAIVATKSQNWAQAKSMTVQAKLDFPIALKALNQTHSNFLISRVGIIDSQINDISHLLKAGEILSNSLDNIIPLIQKFDNIHYQNTSHNPADVATYDKASLLQLIYQSKPKLNSLKINLDSAILNLDQIHRIGILWPVYNKIEDIKQELKSASDFISKASPLIKLLPVLSGTPNTSRFLLILQNNDELRPSGGFIGVYGTLKIKAGHIISLNTNDSYHLDWPASLSPNWELSPPPILKKYLQINKWYLRDANWSPDWPQSAQKITEIYNGENLAIGKASTNFTGVIAITPNLVADLIKLVGPISIQGDTYNYTNFQDLLQYNVEVAYKKQNISYWNRKNIINALMDKLKTRLFNLPASDFNRLFTILDNNINRKDIQIYFSNPAWENLSRTLGTSGEVINTNHDFLMIVDSNLRAFKSDAVMKKDLSYNLITHNGKLKAKLTLNYHHEGKFNWRTTYYRSYTRIYLPIGTKLINIKGLDKTTANISVYNDSTLNKTIFAFFFTVKPGNSRKIIINYILPKRVYEEMKTGNYELLVERQAGQRVNSLTVNLQLGSEGNKKWLTDLNTNKIFKLNSNN